MVCKRNSLYIDENMRIEVKIETHDKLKIKCFVRYTHTKDTLTRTIYTVLSLSLSLTHTHTHTHTLFPLNSCIMDGRESFMKGGFLWTLCKSQIFTTKIRINFLLLYVQSRVGTSLLHSVCMHIMFSCIGLYVFSFVCMHIQ